jgi:hypothetical protein
MTVSASLTAALKTQLETITDIGVVHDRPRYASDWSNYLNLFKVIIGGRSVVRGWMIRRDSAPVGAFALDEIERVHNYNIMGIASLSDSDALSQYDDMQALADTIMALLDNQTTLGVAGVVVRAVGPCSLESYDEQMFGSVLCHVLEIVCPIDVLLPLGSAG